MEENQNLETLRIPSTQLNIHQPKLKDNIRNHSDL